MTADKAFLTFTSESEDDFNNGFLPTLDAQTKVMDNGKSMRAETLNCAKFFNKLVKSDQNLFFFRTP